MENAVVISKLLIDMVGAWGFENFGKYDFIFFERHSVLVVTVTLPISAPTDPESPMRVQITDAARRGSAGRRSAGRRVAGRRLGGL